MYIFIISIIIKCLTCQYLCAMANHAKNVKLAPAVMLHAAALLTSDITYTAVWTELTVGDVLLMFLFYGPPSEISFLQSYLILDAITEEVSLCWSCWDLTVHLSS